MDFTLNAYYTLILAIIVLLIGKFLVKKISFLRNYNIPEPVIGGLVAALIATVVNYFWGFSITTSTELQTSFMLIFFASIGLGANFHRLKEGGKSLVIFLLVVTGLMLIQNIVGLSLAKILGLDIFIGLIASSISLAGGHGTAGAWGSILETKYVVQGATAIGMAAATFGLVIGGIIGGPLAKFLIHRYNLVDKSTKIENKNEKNEKRIDEFVPFEYPKAVRLITVNSAISTLGLFAACLAFADFMANFTKDTVFELPTFIWALFSGVILRNTLENIFKVNIFERAIDVFGNASLSLFLAMALLSLKLWLLSDLAGALTIILTVQVFVMILYAYFVTFRVMGKDYDASVLAAGHCGFGLGATPTAVANMQAITNMYGASNKAFLIVPLCAAFFMDLINATMIQTILKIFG